MVGCATLARCNMDLLACLVNEQETEEDFPPLQIERIATMSTTAPPYSQNKIATKWAQKNSNHQMGIMDTGATSGATAKWDIEALENTSLPSTKVFMLPDMSKIRATQKMLLKHKLWEGAREMNVVPGLHSTLVHPQNGQCRLHCGIRQTQSHHL
jgi:hypothetical protein